VLRWCLLACCAPHDAPGTRTCALLCFSRSFSLLALAILK